MCWVVWVAFSETDKIMSIPNACWHILSAEWKSKELLPCQLPLVANIDNELWWVFPSWYFDLDWNWAGHYTSVTPIATSTINPTDRCDFLIFLHVGTGRREPNVSLHHLFSRHFAGGGRRKKFRKNLSQLQNWTFRFVSWTCRKPQLWWNLEFLKRPGCGKSTRPDYVF